ncbi:MAG: NifB/NifX family molybdenum-iron cluster-binding protein [Candidatus Electryoneaceae bacterium]|nr:NifB/NifX family molybdenum-iron cluster-binding protein [Candidatus Electryoneaceae bacterium]
MHVAFPAESDNLDGVLESSFGRATGFAMVDSETLETKWITNTQNRQAAQGAGIQSAQHVVNAGADAVIVVHCGPKAFRVLTEGEITVYSTEKGTTLRCLIECLNAGDLEPVDGANVEGHWV